MGLPLSLEVLPGEVRRGVSRDGKPWERQMRAAYGYISGTEGMGADGDAVDVYLAADPVETDDVYCITQTRPDGTFDEAKLMLGYPDEETARRDFARHMPAWADGGIDRFDHGDIMRQLGERGVL